MEVRELNGNSNGNARTFMIPSSPKVGLDMSSENKSNNSPQEKEGLTKRDVKKTIQAINHTLNSQGSHLQFKLHDKLHEYYVTIVDDLTNQVIKEIPPKKILDMVASIQERLGILVDHKA